MKFSGLAAGLVVVSVACQTALAEPPGKPGRAITQDTAAEVAAAETAVEQYQQRLADYRAEARILTTTFYKDRQEQSVQQVQVVRCNDTVLVKATWLDPEHLKPMDEAWELFTPQYDLVYRPQKRTATVAPYKNEVALFTHAPWTRVQELLLARPMERYNFDYPAAGDPEGRLRGFVSQSDHGWAAVWLDPAKGDAPVESWLGSNDKPGASVVDYSRWKNVEGVGWVPWKMTQDFRSGVPDSGITRVQNTVELLSFQPNAEPDACRLVLPAGTNFTPWDGESETLEEERAFQ